MQFLPFRAVRFDDPASDITEGVLDLDQVIAPLGAAHDETALSELRSSDSFNVAHLLGEHGAATWASWLETGWTRQDDQAALYLYRIGFRDLNGMPVQVSAVVGLGCPEGMVPGELTLAQRVEPLTTMVTAAGFTDLLVPTDMPLARATDAHGAHHRLWALRSSAAFDLIADAVVTHGGDGFQALERPRMVFASEAGEVVADPAMGMLFLGD